MGTKGYLVVVAMAATACSGDGPAFVDAPLGPDGATIDATAGDDAAGGDAPTGDDAAGGDAAPVAVEGFASVLYRALNNGVPDETEGYFHAWAPGTAVPQDTFDAYYPDLGTGRGLALGACAPVTQPPFTPFTSLRAGNNLAISTGTRSAALTGPSVQGYYFAFDAAAPADYLGTALTLTAGAGSEAVGGPGTLALGTIPSIAIASEPLACTRAAACPLGATIGTVDDVFVLVHGAVVCHLDPAAAPAIPTVAWEGRADGSYSVRLYTVRRSTQQLGGGSYLVVLVHQRSMALSLST